MNHVRSHLLCSLLVVFASACGASNAAAPPAGNPCPQLAAAPPAASSAAPAPVATASAPAAFTPAAPIDEKAVQDATGAQHVDKSADGIVKASWPRSDVAVNIDGWKMPPFMGLTSWVAFAPGRQGVADAMVMGDLVLFEDEVNPVMSKLLDAGLQVTALHNHFFFDSPKVFFMHVGGEGTVADLGEAVKGGIDAIAAIRKKAPKPASSFGDGRLPANSSLDAAKLDAVLGTKGMGKDGMYKSAWGREIEASCGCPAGKSMGVNTWAAFAGSADNAVVFGDFDVTEDELQAVLKALRGGGIDIVAIHNHMTGEHPRILFLHYWGRGKAEDLARTVRKAVDLTAWAGKSSAT